jgi:hypothetical protein
LFNIRETGAEFSDVRRDPISNTPGFEYTSSYSYAYSNGAPTHVYSVETETDSVSVWEMLPGGKVGKFLDRRSDGEQRMRYVCMCVCMYVCGSSLRRRTEDEVCMYVRVCVCMYMIKFTKTA